MTSSLVVLYTHLVHIPLLFWGRFEWNVWRTCRQWTNPRGSADTALYVLYDILGLLLGPLSFMSACSSDYVPTFGNPGVIQTVSRSEFSHEESYRPSTMAGDKNRIVKYNSGPLVSMYTREMQ